ncbi:MAG: hypothetical protein ACRDJC_21545, partial [Thermomicrobiales bacterium]
MHIRALLGVCAMVFSLSSGGAAALAQEPAAQHPADIRAGSCASLGEAVVPLASLTVPAGDPQGQPGTAPVEQSVTVVPMLLADMLANGHALAVHTSPDQVGALVACGDIGGPLTTDGTLAVGLAEMN